MPAPTSAAATSGACPATGTGGRCGSGRGRWARPHRRSGAGGARPCRAWGGEQAVQARRSCRPGRRPGRPGRQRPARAGPAGERRGRRAGRTGQSEASGTLTRQPPAQVTSRSGRGGAQRGSCPPSARGRGPGDLVVGVDLPVGMRMVAPTSGPGSRNEHVGDVVADPEDSGPIGPKVDDPAAPARPRPPKVASWSGV
jgi:hypothetical protein